VTVALADLDVSSTDVPVTVTIANAGTFAGALYVAAAPLAVLAGLIVPQPGEQIAIPCVRVQSTPLVVGSPLTVPMNDCVPFTMTRAEVVDKDTEMGVNTMLARPKAVLSACAFACRNNPRNIVQDPNCGPHGVSGGVNFVGAENVVGAPLAVLLGERVPHAGLHAELVGISQLIVALKHCWRTSTRLHVMPPPVLAAAVKSCFPPRGTDTVLGETDTTVAGTVIVMEADTPASEIDVALRLTVSLLAGAETGGE